ncbi:MAG: PAS domain S-box protein [Leptolyngbyaceae cyanobacterium]
MDPKTTVQNHRSAQDESLTADRGENSDMQTLNIALQTALQQGCEAISWDYGEVWMFQSPPDTLTLSEAYFVKPEHTEAVTEFRQQSRRWTFAKGEGLPGRLWATGQAEWIDLSDELTAQGYKRAALSAAAGLETALGIPLFICDRLIAAFVFYSCQALPPNPEAIRQIQSLIQLGSQVHYTLSAPIVYEREQRFRLLVEHVTDYAIYMLDQDGRVDSWTLAAEKMKGYRETEILGQHYSTFFDPADQAEGLPAQILSTAAATGYFRGKGVRVRKDGSKFWARVVVTALRDEGGGLTGFAKIVQDVTQEHQATEQLKQREAMYGSLFQQSNDGILIHNLEGTILDANNRILALLGYNYDEILQMRVHELHPPEEKEVCRQALLSVQTEGQDQFESYFQRADQTLVPVEISASFMQVGDRRLIQGVVRDISERRQTESKMRQKLEAEKLLTTISTRIRQSLELKTPLQTTTQEVLDFLKVDRTLIYQFSENWGGKVIVEAVTDQSLSILNQPIYDPCFGGNYARLYQMGRVSVVDDIHKANLKACYVEFLEQIQVHASLVVPIIYRENLWGLLVIHLCQAPRPWTPWEVDLISQLSNQVAIAIHQAELYTQIQSELKTRSRIEQDLRNSENAIRKLYEITSASDTDFQERLKQLLQFGREQFGLEVGQLAQITGDTYQITTAQLSNGVTTAGAILDLQQQFCANVVKIQKTLSITHASEQSQWADHPAYQAFGIEAYLGTPVTVNNQIFGTLAFTSRTPHSGSFHPVDRELLQLMAQWIGVTIERRQTLKDLEAAKNKALAGTRSKSEFLATMSHEIRTPMNAIIGMTGLLLDTPLNHQQKDFVETVRNSGETLLTIINDILDFSKIESGRLELEESIFGLRQCVEDALDLIAAQAQQ